MLINPPYAEVSDGVDSGNKLGVSNTKQAEFMGDFGYSKRELFTQFVARILKEIPNSTIAMFSTLKYVNAPNFEQFRKLWNAKYSSGFVVHSKSFDGLNGDFPIGFLIWELRKVKNKLPLVKIQVEVLDKNMKAIGEKTFFNLPNSDHLNSWLPRLKTDSITIPLKNAIHPQTAKAKVSAWHKNAIGYLLCKGGDVQNASHTGLLSSVYSNGCGFYVTPENLWQAAIVFSVRRLIKPTWLNDRDQFLQPTQPLSDEFKHDCLIWMLFNGSNLSASANDLEWNNQKWSIVNHFIPFIEEQVGAKDRFESNFMVDYLKGKKLSPEAKAVLKQSQNLWQIYFSQPNNHKIRAELKLNRSDIGWYQMRKALEARMADGDSIDFGAFKTAYDALSNKLQPQVFELGFMRD